MKLRGLACALVALGMLGARPAGAQTATFDGTFAEQACYDTLVGPVDGYATPPVAGRCRNTWQADATTGVVSGSLDVVSIAGAPVPPFVEAVARTGVLARRELQAPADGVLYTIHVHVDSLDATCAGIELGLFGCSGGAAEGRLLVEVAHDSCSTCSLSQQRALVVSEPAFAFVAPQSLRDQDVTLGVVLTNSSESGAPVPAGVTTVRVGLACVALDGEYGHSIVSGRIAVTSIEVATT
jgi:hypothetical protein